ncbi:MAG: hypothetical protein KKE17_00400 [Proteobacteria bacterium]|nr:hypothetical protein [Pseudomonadota bacterium]MBU1708441.1 hypothetical protein [Pseudomonadota bacterium]
MKNINDRAIIRVIIATGISSVVTQLLVIREFLAQFTGNEFVIALILFSWLSLGGIGTFLANFFSRQRPTDATRLAWLSLLLIALSVSQLFAIRGLRDVFFIHGASIGFYQTLAYAFVIISPYCLLLGFLLPFSLFVLRSRNPDYPGAIIYMMDNLGDVLGGALFSFVLVFLATPAEALLLANLPLMVFSWLLFKPENRCRLLPISGLLFICAILIYCMSMEKPSLAQPEGELVHYNESKFGRITVYKDQEQYTLFGDGVPLFSTQNQSNAEEAIHYPLSQIKSPDSILLISAVGGMMTELEKYHPGQIDYLELDPEMSRVQFEFDLLEKIPNLNIINKDGRAFLTETDTRYNAIVVNLPEPATFQINRFYTDRFFELASHHLQPGGIFSFTMAGFDNYLGEPQRLKLSSLYATVSQHFKHVVLLPGQEVFFLCSDNPIDTDIPGLLAKRGISTSYISNFYSGNVTAERIRTLNELMIKTAPENHDLSPRLMRYMFSQWFNKFSTSPLGFLVIIAVFLMVYFTKISREEYVLFSTGFMTMGSEILVIFAFQIFFGYIYFMIGMIVTVFLAGLLPGAWLGERLRARGKILLMQTDLSLILLVGLFIISVILGADRLPIAFYLGFGFLVSLLCGCQFPVALYLRGGDNPAATRAFSADLIGAAFGTLVTSVVLIPYCGIIWTTLALIGIKIISFVLLASHEKTPSATSS